MLTPDQLAQLFAATPVQRAAFLEAARGGLETQLGVRYVEAGPERVVLQLQVTDEHLQGYGIVHGGIYAMLLEGACSVGAALVVLPQGRLAVGLENCTTFRKATRAGETLTVVAEPGEIDGRRHRWNAQVSHRDGALCAEGYVDVLSLEAGTVVAGEALELKSGS